MKKYYLIGLMFVAFIVNAQEMIVPSSFDENKMIVKRMDEDGNFVPVNEDTISENQSETEKPQQMFRVKKTRLPKKPTLKIKEIPEEGQVNEQKEPRKKRFKKIEKDYSVPKSTFDSDVYDADLPSTFSTETMESAQRDLQEEMYSFEECGPNDKGCQEYETDSKGNVILR